MKTKVIFVSFLAFVFCQCNPKPSHWTEPNSDRFGYVEINNLASSNLDSALLLVAEGKTSGELTAFDAAYISAQLTNKYSYDYRQAVTYCHEALDAIDDPDDIVMHVEAYSLLSRAAYMGQYYDECLDACSKGMELSHQYKLQFADASIDFVVGLCQRDMGLTLDGYAFMNDAVDRALKYVSEESEYEVLVEMLDQLYYCYFCNDDFENMLRVSNLLESTYKNIKAKYPDAMANSNADVLFICPYMAYLGSAIAKASLGQRAEAAADFEKCRSLKFANTTDSYRYQIDYYMAIGAVDSVLAITERYPFHYDDSASWPYQMRIARIERAYRLAGDTEMADLYWHQMDSLTAIIVAQEKEDGLAAIATQYNSKHYRLSFHSIQKDIKQIRTTYIVGIAVCLLLILILLLSQRKRYKRFKNDAKNLESKADNLESEMEQLRKQVQLIIRDDNRAKDTPLPLATFIEERKLYLNKDISREQVADMMGITQRVMTKMLNQIRPDLSFPDYIRSLRIAHALNVMKSNPNYSVQQVADESGFYSVSSFGRAFKAVTGKTPKVYMKNKEGLEEEDLG